MENKQFVKINRILSLAVLAFSSFVYLSTIEPTASFWDCGEFIAAAYKLEVGHQPGNPVFKLFARMFTLFTDSTHAAAAVNCFSAMCSAFTIFFLFLSIVHFGRRIMEKSGKALTKANAIAVWGAGVVGSLAYCFSDTFWFSAVEGEVYAMSSLLTAVVFWAILKWEEEADTKYANRWIVLISFLMGLSIGVHLLNLLAIPAIVFIYYYKKHENEKMSLGKGFLILALSGVILGVILFGIIPYVPKITALVDRIFVNILGLPYNVGAALFMAALFVSCFVCLRIFRAKGNALWHTITLCFTTILIGYSVFAVVMIRANANTPMNEYQPDNAYTLVRYLSREQYGKNPVIYGESYTSPMYAGTDTYWTPLDGKYYKADSPLHAEYPAGAKMIFPRMWSTQSSAHTSFYDVYTNNNFKNVNVVMPDGSKRVAMMPRFADNLRFFFDYQLNYMYFRYFFWNFVGRQNDLHGETPGDPIRGNWESGIKFIDQARLGEQETGPDYIINNRGKNHYYFLPLILGLIGFFFQLRKDGRNCWITSLLFLLTGVAIIVYLNQSPYQVRERDYAYAGSFYVFTIWIGLAVMSLKEAFDKVFKKKEVASASSAAVLCLAVSVLMGCENWDDHDRSHRRTARDLAINYLESCDDQAIIITHGDNDTFPLWYAQEVEGVRRDVRIMNTSLLGMDWYIDQMKVKCYDSEPLPISTPRRDYLYGTNDYVDVIKAIDRPITAREAMAVFSDPKYRQRANRGVIVSDRIRVPVNKENAVKYGIVNAKDADKMVDFLEIELKERNLSKTDLIILDILSNYEWDRPIYFVTPNGDCSYDLRRYLRCEGLTYKIVPFDINAEPSLAIDADKIADRILNKYALESFKDTTFHVDYQNLYTFCAVTPIRATFVETAQGLYEQGKNAEALEILDRCFEYTPQRNFPYNASLLNGANNDIQVMAAIDLYLALDQKAKALSIAEKFITETSKTCLYCASSYMDGLLDNQMLRKNAQYLYYLANVFKARGMEEEAKGLEDAIGGMFN